MACPGPWLELARSNQVLGRYDKALETAETALVHDPENPDTHGTKALALWQLGRGEDALAALDRALELAPEFAKLRFNCALLLLRSGHRGEALAAARVPIADRDIHWPAWRLIGEMEAARGNDPAAIEAWLKALEAEPRTPRAHEALIRTLQEGGHADLAAWHRWPDRP